MKKFTKNLLLMFMAFSVLTIVSCGEDEEVIGGDPDPTSEFDARLNTSDDDSLSATVFLSDVDDNVIDVFMSFSSENETMRRLYATVDVQGQGAVEFELTIDAEKKDDGSLELDGPQGESFAVNLDIATAGLPSEGTVVYNFWTTTGRGDYRDPSKRQATEVLTLTVDLEGTNPAKILNESSVVIQLEAPLGDATSSTFISTYDLQTYEISEGEELAALWDFGYYYLNSTGASFASTATYPELFADPDGGEDLVTVNEFLNIETTEVNNCYFQLAPDGTDFSSFETSDDFTFTITESEAAERINQLEIGDVVYILDQYGKKGVIEITDIEPGFGSGDYIEFNIKVER